MGIVRLAAVVVLLSFRVGLAQCTAFLAPPDTKVFRDDAGKKPYLWTAKDGRLTERLSDYVILLPRARIDLSVNLFVQIARPPAITWGACLPQDFKTNKKSGLTRLALWVGPLRALEDVYRADPDPEEVWASTADLVAFTWPFSIQGSSTENWSVVRRQAAFELDRIKNADFKAPEVKNQETFAADYEKTWTAVIETMSDQKWQIESIDKGSGLVTTKPAVDRRGSSMVCATKFDEDHSVWLNVFAKKVEAGTRVKVNATFRAMRDGKAIACYSNGTIEQEVFGGIRESLGPAPPPTEPPKPAPRP